MTTSAPLEIHGLVKRFADVTAVDGIDLTLGTDELLALVGPSGCGKSTLLRAIAGLVDADEGMIRLGGEVVDDGAHRLPPERRHVGLVFQEHALFPHLTVRDNIGFGVRNGSKRDVAARVDEMLELVTLDGYGDRFPHELSGGERQRVALARALAPSPALMLFDEPFASLDHNLRVQLRADVVSALKATGTPAVFVTHDQAEALAIGDRIAVMRNGRIQQLDAPATVFHRPIDGFTASFMGEASFLPIAVGGGSPMTALGPVEVGELEPASAMAMVRPDDVHFASTPHGDAEITAAEYRGSEWLVTVRLPTGESVQAAASHLDELTIGARGKVALVEGHRQVALPHHDHVGR